jgi:proteasome lid subunit RPN8/RPN11
MHQYAQVAETEIAGLGRVLEYPGLVLVTDVFVVPQVSSSANAELDSDAVADMACELARNGGLEQIRFFWHSHAEMGCFFSGIDNSTIEAFGAPYLISTVVNKRGSEAHRLDIFEPLRISLGGVHIRTLDRKTLRAIADLEVKDSLVKRDWRLERPQEACTYDQPVEE